MPLSCSVFSLVHVVVWLSLYMLVLPLMRGVMSSRLFVVVYVGIVSCITGHVVCVAGCGDGDVADGVVGLFDLLALLLLLRRTICVFAMLRVYYVVNYDVVVVAVVVVGCFVVGLIDVVYIALYVAVTAGCCVNGVTVA